MCCFCIYVRKVSPEIPQPFDYIGKGFGLECYECHSNRPGCGREIDWILSRWKRCDMPIPKCVKIIEKIGSEWICVVVVVVVVVFVMKTTIVSKFNLISFFQHKAKLFTFAAVCEKSRLHARTYRLCARTAAGRSTASMSAGAATYSSRPTRPSTASATNETAATRPLATNSTRCSLFFSRSFSPLSSTSVLYCAIESIYFEHFLTHVVQFVCRSSLLCSVSCKK